LDRRTDARLSALSAIFALEEFANRCDDTLGVLDKPEYELSVINGEGPWEARFRTVPEMPPYSPSEINLRALGVDASRDILNFQIHARSARSAASLQWSPYLPDAFAKVKLYTSQLGVEALQVSEKLRGKWHLDSFHSVNVVDLKAHLLERGLAYKAEREAITRRTTPRPNTQSA